MGKDMKEKWTMKMIYTEICSIVTFSTTFFHSSEGDLSYAEQLPRGVVNKQVGFCTSSPV